MRKTISTIRRRSGMAKLGITGGSLALTLSLAGLAVSPFRASNSLRNQNNAEDARREVLVRQQAIVQQLEEQQVVERVDKLLLKLDGAVPSATDKVRLFYFVQLISSALDIELQTLTTGEPEALGMPIGEEDIAQRRVSLVGQARLLDLVDLVEALRTMGLPVAIQEVRANQDSAKGFEVLLEDQRYQFSMTLCVFERMHVSPMEETIAGVAALPR